MRDVVDADAGELAAPAGRRRGSRATSAGRPRFETTVVSCASVPAWGNTHRSRGTPRRSARLDRAQDQRRAPCSTLLFEFMSFGYGKPIIRLYGAGVRISSARVTSRIHAFGLPAATSLNRAHSSETCAPVLVERRAPTARAARSRTSGTPAPASPCRASSSSGWHHPHLCADQPRRRHLVGLLVPLEDHIGAAGAHPGAPRLSRR